MGVQGAGPLVGITRGQCPLPKKFFFFVEINIYKDIRFLKAKGYSSPPQNIEGPTPFHFLSLCNVYMQSIHYTFQTGMFQ